MNEKESMTVLIALVAVTLLLVIFTLVGIMQVNRKTNHLMHYGPKAMYHAGSAVFNEARADVCRKAGGELDRNGTCVGMEGRRIEIPDSEGMINMFNHKNDKGIRIHTRIRT